MRTADQGLVMNAVEQTYERVPDSPVGWSSLLKRRIRDDGLESLGTSTQTLAELALSRGDFDVAADLAWYFHEEMTRINEAVLAWIEQILDFRLMVAGLPQPASGIEAAVMVGALRTFDAGQGDLAAALASCRKQDATAAAVRIELMRTRIASVHDLLVWWVQGLLTELAATRGEDAVRDVVVQTYEVLWGPRYANWEAMTPLERLQLSVEGMRGHLSGPRHRGDVGIKDTEQAYVMVLDPCGSCGVLRRGDPDSGRLPGDVQGTTQAHSWAYERIGLGWYAAHSAIVMEWLQVQQGRPPLRPLLGCDQQGPCTWYVYKDPASAMPQEPSMVSLFTSRRKGSGGQ